MTQHVLFTKVGWMEDYKGVTDNDPKPEGAGRWNENENNVGGEAWNFLPVGGACYGFAETKAHDHGFNLPRVAPGATGPSLSGVLLVFLANVPNESSPNETRRQLYSKIGKGIRIVGWYRNCEIYSTCRKLQSGLRDLHSGSYNAMCSVEDAVLVPVADRKSPIDLSGKGGMLRSNVRYLYSEAGQRKKWPWMDEVLKLIATHESNAKRLGPEILFPDEIREPEKFFEGAKKQVVVNAYERDSNAREKCIARYGYGCNACGFNFAKTYGKLGRAYIHVHHLKPLSTIGKGYFVDPIEDLRPVYPNCHAMLHRHDSVISIEELRAIIAACR